MKVTTANKIGKQCKDIREELMGLEYKNPPKLLPKTANIEECCNSSADREEPRGGSFSGWKGCRRYNEACSSNLSTL